MVVKAKMVAAENGEAGAGAGAGDGAKEQLVRASQGSEGNPLRSSDMSNIPRDSDKVGPAIRINLSEKVAGDRDTDIEAF
jgi:hypothetical protein